MSRINLYSKVQELSKVLEQKQRLVEDMIKAKSELGQQDLDAMRALQRCEVRLNHHKQALQENNYAKLELNG